ncbi:MAG: TetR/AcrR family transcriptional regulator [Mycobacterium sp.]
MTVSGLVVPAPTLRERKRNQTWAAIHEIAAEAALRCDCLAEITVDEIANRADVSTRTFFNYFSCKEDAVLGLRSPRIDDDLAENFELGVADDPVEKVAALMYAVSRDAGGSRTNRDRRFALMRRHPDLAHRLIEHVETIKDLVRKLVSRDLARSPRWLTAHHDYSVDEAAEILVAAAHSVVRIVIKSQLDTGTSPVASLTPLAHGGEDELVRSAARLFRNVIEEI